MVPALRLADLLAGLSIVTDIGFGLPQQAAMRASVLSTALARKLDLSDADARDAFYVPLLTHVGCVSFAHETAALFVDELVTLRAVAMTNMNDPDDVVRTLVPETTRHLPAQRRASVATAIIEQGREFGRRFDTASCEVGRETARRIGLPDSTQEGLYSIAESWDGSGAPRNLAGDDIPVASRIARLAADAAFFDTIQGPEAAAEAVRARAGTAHDPAIAEVFLKDAPDLLAEVNSGDPSVLLIETEPTPVVEIDAPRLPEVAEAFGDATDLKNPYMHGHARAVADLAARTADPLGLGTEETRSLHVAALLHDVGRVGVSNAIWEKRGALTRAEWEQVRLHPYHSERILATSRVLQPIAQVAGMHHERLDGSGYHRCCGGESMPMTARVLAVADALVGMTQHRPHRAALGLEKATSLLMEEARGGRLDRDVVGAVVDAVSDRKQTRRNLLPAGLTQREVEVLRLIADGRSNVEISTELHISRRTAEHHVQSIYTKIGLSTRAGAAFFALEHDLLPRTSLGSAQ